jgi:hypothetical protein
MVAGKAFMPIVLRGGKDWPENAKELFGKVELFKKHEKGLVPLGWRIEWKTRKSKRFGAQQWPEIITVETEEDYLHLTGRQDLAARFKAELARLLGWRPELRHFLFLRPEFVLDLNEAWHGIRAVVDYLLTHDVRDYYIRSLPVPVHTKFIQQYRNTILALLQYFDPDRFPPQGRDLEEALGLRRKPFLFPMRWLDIALAASCSADMEIFAVTVKHLACVSWAVHRVILVENETNLLMLPGIQDCFALFSSGKALSLLENLSLFRRAQIYYWGDLDEEGYVMLNAMRGLYGHVISLFMDIETVSFHKRQLLGQPNPYKARDLPLLTPAESQAYRLMAATDGRIEQEQLDQEFVARRLNLLTQPAGS